MHCVEYLVVLRNKWTSLLTKSLNSSIQLGWGHKDLSKNCNRNIAVAMESKQLINSAWENRDVHEGAVF